MSFFAQFDCLSPRLSGMLLFLLTVLVWGCAERAGNPADSLTEAEAVGDSGTEFLPELPPVADSPRDTFSVRLTKWFGGHRAAISLTYDHGVRWLSEDEALIQDIVAEQNLPMDFDFTNSDLDEWPARRRYYLETLIPKGINVFGHGYLHINSDEISEDSARSNFSRCYADMVASGLKPIAYAYPGGIATALQPAARSPHPDSWPGDVSPQQTSTTRTSAPTNSWRPMTGSICPALSCFPRRILQTRKCCTTLRCFCRFWTERLRGVPG